MNVMVSKRFEVVATGGALGADIVGLNLRAPIEEAEFRRLYKAWNDHLVLRFRGQALDDEALARFSRRFGELDMAPIGAVGTDYGSDAARRPDVAVISNIVVDGKAIGGLGNAELVWHQDMSYNELPPKASLLYCLETPASGAETFFYNLYAAFEGLPADLARRIEGRLCKHDATHTSAGELRRGYRADYSNEERPGAVHPLVIRHPESGRRGLYLGRRPYAWVVGLSQADSDALLDALWAHVGCHDLFWAQQWQVGDLVIWDNRCTLHRRNHLDPQTRRLMHRTQVRDSARPVAA